MAYLIGVQGAIRTSIASQLTAFAATGDWSLLAAMLPLGIGFGAVHALTPGHGKLVLASYLSGSRLSGLRSLGVSGALTLTHVGSAVLLGLLGAPLITRTLAGVGRAPALETVSRTLLTGIGGWLLYRAVRNRPHDHDERNGLMVGISAGLIPCPLTLFAMVFALARHAPEAGLMFAFAMLLGVGTTLGMVALTTVLARGWALRFAERHGGSVHLLTRVADGFAGAALIAFSIPELLQF